MFSVWLLLILTLGVPVWETSFKQPRGESKAALRLQGCLMVTLLGGWLCHGCLRGCKLFLGWQRKGGGYVSQDGCSCSGRPTWCPPPRVPPLVLALVPISPSHPLSHFLLALALGQAGATGLWSLDFPHPPPDDILHCLISPSSTPAPCTGPKTHSWCSLDLQLFHQPLQLRVREGDGWEHTKRFPCSVHALNPFFISRV